MNAQQLRAGLSKALEVVRRGAPARVESRLSERERAVMIGLGHGERVKDIALRLHLSPSTVSTYRLRILEKLDLENDAQLVLLVAELESTKG